MDLLIFKPLYQERVWGGRDLQTALGRSDVPAGSIIGESWEIVDRPEAQSVVSSGPLAGRTLRELIQAEPEAIMGAGWPASRPFPILVKWLDCQQRLSLQVHPPADIAPELGGEPKTECWYIAHAQPHAALMAGLKAGVSLKQFEKALNANELEPLVHRMPVRTGESIFIPSGRLHAIDGGNLILEVQQNSDTTYRVYDWGRVGLDGKPRDLHIEASMKSIDFEDFEPETDKPLSGEQLLADSDVFRLRAIDKAEGASLEYAPGQPRLLSVVKGSFEDAQGQTFPMGTNALVPACSSLNWTAAEAAKVLVTDQFATI
jgi:mannose-6-phosphate isomerase